VKRILTLATIFAAIAAGTTLAAWLVPGGGVAGGSVALADLAQCSSIQTITLAPGEPASFDAANCILRVASGAPGVDGQTGQAGPSGAPGSPGTDCTGAAPITPARTCPGAQGPQGVKGDTGATGSPGVSGYQRVTQVITEGATSCTSGTACATSGSGGTPSYSPTTVSCPAGKKIVGSGWAAAVPSSGPSVNFRVLETGGPTSDTTWQVQMYNASGATLSSNTAIGTFTLICVTAS